MKLSGLSTLSVATTSRVAALVTVVMGVGSMVWAGCGGGNGYSYCNETGCYQCDGYGCQNAPTPTPVETDASAGGPDVGIVSTPDTGSTSNPDGGSDAADSSSADAADAADTNTHCTSSSQCTGASQECWQSQCITCGGTSGPCPCAATSDCSGGNVCAGGECTPPTDTCVYTSDCGGTNRVCANGQCVAGCSAAAPCAGGSTCTGGACVPSTAACTSNASCTSNAPYCVEGACAAACSGNASCATGDYCNQGACVPDTRPQPECTSSSTCDSNQECVNGFCEYTCTTSMQCALIDARIAYCGQDGVCRDSTEANPMCTQQSDCASGQSCVSNTCQ